MSHPCQSRQLCSGKNWVNSTFLDYDNVLWNNNNVEYAIKTCKDFLRPTMGLSTVNGLEAHLKLLSIYQTCKYKEINFLDFLLLKGKNIEPFRERPLNIQNSFFEAGPCTPGTGGT